MEHIVLCPGSRSSPLALSAGHFADHGGFKLFTAIDERSAGFLALGLATSIGKAVAVVTTSGTAVANLLPAAIEADRSCQPILFLTADRPFRLKNCGANQTVNQEEFLVSVCRLSEQGPLDGLHALSSDSISILVDKTWESAHSFPGPVHLNLPIEETLHPSLDEQDSIFSSFSFGNNFKSKGIATFGTEIVQDEINHLPVLDPSQPGVVVAGPWRGSSGKLSSFQIALKEWYELSRWPILADPLAGVAEDQPGLIRNWELLLSNGFSIPEAGGQVLRLGPMPASRALQGWLSGLGSCQLLITEGDSRKLDPLRIASQWSKGLLSWWELQKKDFVLTKTLASDKSRHLLNEWIKNDQIVQDFLEQRLPLQGPLSEPALAFWLNRLLPEGLPIMLAASSPLRDWITFGGGAQPPRRCFGFRGASGIDGTLSLGIGLAIGQGQIVLVTGDLALLHDSNGWLLAKPNSVPLLVVVIDNDGGGIFQQLDIEVEPINKFNQLFAMPQVVDHCAIAEAHNIPYRQVACLEDLKLALEWGLNRSGPALIRVCTQSYEDAVLRRELRKDLSNYFLPLAQND